ncbi:hypothetical protein [Streptomyces sp. NBC_00557]|uniref:hypothetical protein n=1 Tax=Streptomyces sp. NBC_00557 TaxID=2975776 RepID=UPI002E80945E|nr:hypothetical protein [Streptomyces sp. NBC_00557]WUC39892.1 hypothetical protein OG956_14950 [Streptomyces sp. NBC_00557]
MRREAASACDKRMLRRRVYGADRANPGPQPGRCYVELVGGPLDGMLLDITGWTHDEVGAGAALATGRGQHGVGDRVMYAPRRGDAARFDWCGYCA